MEKVARTHEMIRCWAGGLRNLILGHLALLYAAAGPAARPQRNEDRTGPATSGGGTCRVLREYQVVAGSRRSPASPSRKR